MAGQITPFPPLRRAAAAISSVRVAPQRPAPDPHAVLDQPHPQRGRAETGQTGFGAILDQGLGDAHLPDAIELVAALEAAGEHAPLADRAVPGLGKLVSAVIEDETHKLLRYLDLRTR